MEESSSACERLGGAEHWGEAAVLAEGKGGEAQRWRKAASGAHGVERGSMTVDIDTGGRRASPHHTRMGRERPPRRMRAEVSGQKNLGLGRGFRCPTKYGVYSRSPIDVFFDLDIYIQLIGAQVGALLKLLLTRQTSHMNIYSIRSKLHYVRYFRFFLIHHFDIVYI